LVLKGRFITDAARLPRADDECGAERSGEMTSKGRRRNTTAAPAAYERWSRRVPGLQELAPVRRCQLGRAMAAFGELVRR
jgi:hypothetical protein